MEKIQDLIHAFNLVNWHTPPVEWARINHDLNKVYKAYGIEDDKTGKNIKNTARHFTGGALGKKFYGNDLVLMLGDLKERFDNKRDNKPLGFDYDAFIDKVNNQRGMAYTQQNPESPRKKVYDAALKQAIKNYNLDYPNK